MILFTFTTLQYKNITSHTKLNLHRIDDDDDDDDLLYTINFKTSGLWGRVKLSTV